MRDVQRSATPPAEFIRLGFEDAIGADTQIVIRQQAIDLRHVIGELGLPLVQFQPFNFLVGIFVMGKKGMRLGCTRGQQYKDEEQSADRGKQPTMLGMSAHNRTGC